MPIGAPTIQRPWLTEYSSKRAEIPVYSFAKHQRLEHTTSIYSPHVLILEGIFALYDPRVLELLDMGVSRSDARSCADRFVNAAHQIYCEADADTCLSRRSNSAPLPRPKL